MSFDVLLQAFECGDAASRDGEEVRRLLLARGQGDPRDGFLRLSETYGDAEVYGIPDKGEPLQGLMFTHFSEAAYDTIVAVAQVADLVVMPIGCRICVVRDAQREHLPDELTSQPIELIHTGEDLATVIAM